MRKAIVTGANGFVGAAICHELASQGVQVIAVVRDENSDIHKLTDLKDIQIIYCELKDYRKLPSLIHDDDLDVFYHLAWAGTSGGLRGDSEIQLDNVKFTCDAVRACVEMNCGRFVFAASIMEYEIQKSMETEQVPGINTLYCTAKLTADYMAKAIATELGIDYIRAVISNIYGPGEVSARLINTSIRKLLRKEHCAFSPGEQMYDFVYIEDAAKAFCAIGESGVTNRTYYIGSTSPRPLKDFLIEMKEQVEPTQEIGLGELPFSGVSLGYDEFDVWAVTRDTGFEPQISFAEGIQRTTEWIKCQEFDGVICEE